MTISRAEVNGGKLRIEGRTAANRTITVDGVAMGTSDGAGQFRIERAGFTAPADCTIAVNDGSATAATATVAGCTVSAPPPSTAPSLAVLALGQTTVVGGTPVTATVSVDLVGARRGRGGLTVSDNPTAATVPASVLVPAGATSVTFTVTTSAVTASTPVTITASAGGVVRTTTLTVNPAGQSATLTVTATGRSGERVTSNPAGIKRSGREHRVRVVRGGDLDHAERHQQPRRDLVRRLFQRREQDQDLHLHAERQRQRNRQRPVAL